MSTTTDPPTLFVLVGLPGAGKTTAARRLEVEHRALRLSPDEWMQPLFGRSEADGARDVLEGRFVWLAGRALRLGSSVVLDFGLWGRDERSALRHLAAQAGGRYDLVYLPVEEDVQRRRLAARRGEDGRPPEGTFEISDEVLAAARRTFQPPDAREMAATDGGPVPAGFASWAVWTAERWPTSTT